MRRTATESRARRGATAQLLAVGRRGAGGARDPRVAVQSLCLALAAVAAALLLWGAEATHSVYGAREDRIAARMPLTAAPGTPPVAWWWEQPDTWGDHGFSVVTVRSTGASAPPPPGLPRWPAPGETYVSPALLAVMPEAATRYGRLVGTIGPDGLADPGELLVYRDPEAGTELAAGAPFRGISGFGASTGPTPPFISQGFDRAEADFHWLLVPFLGLPALVLLVVAARLGARGRDRRLAVLHAIGAGPSVRARIAAGECLRPLALGTAVAGVPLTVLAFTGLRLPLTGYGIAARDLAPLRWAFPLSLLVLWALLCLVFAALHLRIRRATGSRPLREGDRPPAWPGVLCGFGTLAALWGAMIGDAVGVRIFTLSSLIALAGLPPLLGRAAARLSVRLAGHHRGDAARLIGNRWAAAHPGVVARTCAALAVLLGLLAQVQVSVTELSSEARHAGALAGRLDGRLHQVDGASTPAEATLFLAGLGPEDLVLRISEPDHGPGADPVTGPGPGSDSDSDSGRTDEGTRTASEPPPGRPVLVGDCRALAALGALRACPRDRAVPASEAYDGRTARTEALRWMSFGDVRVRAATGTAELREGGGSFVVLTEGPGGAARVERAAYAALPLPHVSVPGTEFTVGASARARIADWVLLVALTGFAFLALTGAAGLLHAFLDRAETLRPLAGYTSGVRFHLRVAWWGMGVPTLSALVLATLFAGLLAAFNLGFLAPSGDSPLGLLVGGLVLASAVCAVATAAGGWLAARFTHRWVPHGD